MEPSKEKSFEDNLGRLQEIVTMLESDDLSLEKGLSLYKEGLECSKMCRERLEKAQHDISIWQDGDFKSFSVENDQTDPF